MTRCKFVCDSVTKSQSHSDKNDFLFEAEFFPVSHGSDENKEFFTYTPTGHLKIGVYKDDVFLPGKEYFIDISLAE